MPRLSADQWQQIRAEREAGASFGESARKHDIDKAAIVRRAKREGWGDGSDVGDLVRRKVTEKLTGVVIADPAKKAAAIDAAALRAANVVATHQREWQEHRELFPTPEIKADFQLGKSAKISSEMLMIRQKGERIAWGLEEAQKPGDVVVSWRGLDHG